MQLTDKHIVLGISGGIAAYKCLELVRALRAAGAEVQVVMTAAASEFVTALSLQAVSGRPVRQALFDSAAEAAMGHIELARWADAIVIAPATAHCLARLAQGMADDLLSTLCLASRAPLAVAPAMNQAMWAHPATQANLAVLQQRGVDVFGPASGEQACGDVGPGRMLEPMALVAAIGALFSATDLQGQRVLITAGPTREALDPVRFISNHSSGKMGFALAQAAAAAGAEVRLVAGPVQLPTPAGVSRVDVETALEMQAAVMATVADCDIFIATAAVADYRPTLVAEQKIKKQATAMTLNLIPNPDIVAGVAALPVRPFVVGFAAETEQLAVHARDKLQRKQLDMIAANCVSAPGLGFNSDRNALEVFWAEGEASIAAAQKLSVAQQLLELICQRMRINKCQ